MNTASNSRTLPSNIVINLKEDLKGITTRSGVDYKGPTIPITSSPKVVEREPEVTKDMMPPTNNGSTKDVQPPVVPVVHHESISEPINAPISASMPNQKASIPFLSRRNNERRREKANDQIEKCYKIFRDLSFEISVTVAYAYAKKIRPRLFKNTLNRKQGKDLLLQRPWPILVQCINLMPLFRLENFSSSELTPTCMTLELADRSISEPIGIAEDVYVTVGKFQFLADFVVVDFEPDPRVPLILGRSFLKTSRALIDVYEGEITLRIGREAITFIWNQLAEVPANHNHMTANRHLTSFYGFEEYSQEVLGFSNGAREYASTTRKLNDRIKVYRAKVMLSPCALTDYCIVYTDHSAIKYLFAKKDAKPRLMRWILLLQEFDVIIRDKRREESGADIVMTMRYPHQDKKSENTEIHETCPLETLGSVALRVDSTPWFADFTNYHAGNFIVKGMSSLKRKKCFSKMSTLLWDDPFLFKICADQMIPAVCARQRSS
ncbi:reverse transcriptase domain-containing protein [Tanacetum coccineum]